MLNEPTNCLVVQGVFEVGTEASGPMVFAVFVKIQQMLLAIQHTGLMTPGYKKKWATKLIYFIQKDHCVC